MLEAACFDCGKHRPDTFISHICDEIVPHPLSTAWPYSSCNPISTPTGDSKQYRCDTEVDCVILSAQEEFHMKSSRQSSFCSCDVLFRGPRAFEIQEFATVRGTSVAVCSTSLLAKLPI